MRKKQLIVKLYILIIELETGEPIYVNNYGLIKEEEKTLFSGLLTAIQSLLAEMKMGKIKSIKTNEFTITGEIKGKLAYFLIGKFEITPKIRTFLGQLYETLSPAEDDIIRSYKQGGRKELIKTLNTIVEVNIKKFLDQELEVGIIYRNENEFIKIYDIDDTMISETVYGYIVNAADTFASRDYSFYLQIREEKGVLLHKHAIETKKNEGIIYLFVEYKNKKVLENLSYKPLFSEMAGNFIEQNIDYILEISYNNRSEEKKELDYLIATFIEDLRSTQLTRVRESTQAMKTVTIEQAYGSMDKFLNTVSIVLQGQPLAFSQECSMLKEKIHLLSTLLEINNYSFEPTETTTSYPRVTITPEELIQVTQELGYAVFTSEKIIGRKNVIDTKCLHELIHAKQSTEEITEIIREISRNALMLVRAYLYNEDFDELLDSMALGGKNCKKMYLNIIQWMIPHFKHPLIKNWQFHYIDW